jgi:hypothetical protein
MNNIIEIIIAAKDAASSVIMGAFSRINQANAAYSATLQSFNGHVQGAVANLMNLAGPLAGAAGILPGLTTGIQAVDEFRLATIGVASTLTDMADSSSTDLKSIYELQ